MAFEVTLEGFIYAEAGVRKDKQRARGGQGKVEMGNRQWVS